MSTIEDRVKNAIASILYCDMGAVQPESRIIEDLGADSLQEVEIIMEIENEFEIDILDEDADKIKTVQQAIDYVTSKVKP